MGTANDLLRVLKDRLNEGGWVQIRQGARHVVYKHPNGSVYMLPFRVSDTGRRRVNMLKEIEKKERLK